jgi:hypothetical protein
MTSDVKSRNTQFFVNRNRTGGGEEVEDIRTDMDIEILNTIGLDKIQGDLFAECTGLI